MTLQPTNSRFSPLFLIISEYAVSYCTDQYFLILILFQSMYHYSMYCCDVNVLLVQLYVHRVRTQVPSEFINKSCEKIDRLIF